MAKKKCDNCAHCKNVVRTTKAGVRESRRTCTLHAFTTTRHGVCDNWLDRGKFMETFAREHEGDFRVKSLSN